MLGLQRLDETFKGDSILCNDYCLIMVKGIWDLVCPGVMDVSQTILAATIDLHATEFAILKGWFSA